MKRFWTRLLAAVMCMALLCPAALADSAGISWAAGDYLTGDEVRFHLTAQIDALTPYGDGTLDMMNALLQNLSVSASLKNGGADTDVHFCVAGDSVASFSERQAEEGVAFTTSLLPRRTLTGEASVLNALSGLEQEESTFDLFTAIRTLQKF